MPASAADIPAHMLEALGPNEEHAMKLTAWHCLVSLAAAFLAMLPMRAAAISPRYVPDEELVREPIMVVARWPRARFTSHSRIEHNAVYEQEVHTELVVERAIRGDVRPGR